ncbi:MAG: hypothetical protein K5855_02265 [Oscillospiraceae bacterium]|nr:hypothetical protein [Oscillospiraceae bacterium]
MDSIDRILEAEKQAEFIKNEGREKAASIIAEAEAYRGETLKKARLLGEELSEKLMEEAGAEARTKAGEYGERTAGEIERLRAEAAARLEKAADFIAESIIKG